MRRLRKVAVFLLVLLLGLVAWFILLVCFPTSSELRLSRQLSTGMLIARVPEPRSLFLGRIIFGPSQLSGRYSQIDHGRSGPIPPGVIFVEPPKGGIQTWQVRLDPLDKTWDLEVVEKRIVSVRFGSKSWRIGTKTKIWRTRRKQARTTLNLSFPQWQEAQCVPENCGLR